MRRNLVIAGVVILVVAAALLPRFRFGTLESSTIDWWDNTYTYRFNITVNPTGEEVQAGHAVQLTFDHAALVGANHSLANGDDIRVLYWTGSSWSELDRVLDPQSTWNSASTTLWFQIESNVEDGSPNDNYYVYYGKPTAISPPADPDNIFRFFDTFEGGSLDGGKWGCTGTCTVSGGSLILDDSSAAFSDVSQLFGVDTVWEARMRWGGTGSPVEHVFGGSDQSPLQSSSGEYAAFRYTAGFLAASSLAGTTGETNTGFVPGSATTYATYRFAREGTAGLRFYDGASEVAYLTTSVPVADLRLLLSNGTGGDDPEYDWVRVRSFMTLEPQILTGMEENFVPTNTPTPTDTPTPTPTPTNTPTPTDTPTPSPTPTETPIPTDTPIPSDTLTPTVTPTPTRTPTPSRTPTPTVPGVPSNTPSPTAIVTPSITPTPTTGRATTATPTALPGANTSHLFLTSIGSIQSFVSTEDIDTVPDDAIETTDTRLTVRGIAKAGSTVTISADPDIAEKSVTALPDSSFTWNTDKAMSARTYTLTAKVNDGTGVRVLSGIKIKLTDPSKSTVKTTTAPTGAVPASVQLTTAYLSATPTPATGSASPVVTRAPAQQVAEDAPRQLVVTLLDEEGNPMAETRVVLADQTVTTDAEGKAILEKIPPGEYTLEIETPKGTVKRNVEVPQSAGAVYAADVFVAPEPNLIPWVAGLIVALAAGGIFLRLRMKGH